MTHVPSVLSDLDLAEWQALSGEEQLRRLQSALQKPECAEVSLASMKDIRARAQLEAKSRRE